MNGERANFEWLEGKGAEPEVEVVMNREIIKVKLSLKFSFFNDIKFLTATKILTTGIST